MTSASHPAALPALKEREAVVPDTDSLALPISSQDIQIRYAYPEALWSRILDLIPLHRKHQAVAVNVAAGQGMAGLELAQRGLNVLSVGGSAVQQGCTLLHADTNADTHVDVIAAQLEPSVVRDNAADLVTCMDSLHVVNAATALREAHRILRPGGKLVVALTDRDDRHMFVDMVEEVTEDATDGVYSRAAAQHTPQAWAPLLRQGGRFKLLEYATHDNPVALMGGLDHLADEMAGQPTVAAALSGPALDDFKADISSLAQWAFGQNPVVLAQQTRVFVLEKVTPPLRG
ncbi:hypothetical protein N2152v2_000208 [Parachlorella kessleri]